MSFCLKSQNLFTMLSEDLLYSSNDKIIEVGNRAVVARGWGRICSRGWERYRGSREVGVVIEGQHEGSLWWSNCSVPWLWWWIQVHTIQMHRTGHAHTHETTSKTEKNWITELRPLDYTNTLTVMLYYTTVLQDFTMGVNEWRVHRISPHQCLQLHVNL